MNKVVMVAKALSAGAAAFGSTVMGAGIAGNVPAYIYAAAAGAAIVAFVGTYHAPPPVKGA